MTQEQKDLLIRDLCARVPYGVKAQGTNDDGTEIDTIASIEPVGLVFMGDEPYEHSVYNVENVKPILRAMTDMPKLDVDAFCAYWAQCKYMAAFGDITEEMNRFTMWLDKNHYDHRGLIKQGLAIELTDGNNPYKK